MIDLTKLKALELPTEEIEIEILGEKQKTVVCAFPQHLSVKIAAMYEIKGNDPELPTEIIREVLKAGAKELSADDIELLLNKDYRAATSLAAAIRDLSDKFSERKSAKSKELEKNLNAAELENEKIS